ncbi:MAG: DNA replication/repair protein RecF [Chromatiales bacterium]|nr:DNA replication/repair protein RecF [Chromatiales bacterium]
MQFNRVEVTDFRNLSSTSFNPSPSLNLILGSNGSGKSSLIEAIHYLATGSSFRTNKFASLIHYDSPCFTLFTEIAEDDLLHKIGLRRCRDLNHTTRLDGVDLSRRSQLAQLLPLQIISPESISLLIEGSEKRRSFIDWSLFHVEHTFHYHSSNYLRVLKQRNALLRLNEDRAEFSHWNSQLAQYGEEITALRRRFVDEITLFTYDLLTRLLPDVEINFQYRQGWPSGYSLSSALETSLESDLKLKYTTVGPHRADLVIRSNNGKASELLSRGQQKLVVVALRLAQTLHLFNLTGRRPVFLIDDLAAELDPVHRELFINILHDVGSQIFISTPDQSLIETERWSESKVFHVEHGQVKEML